MPNQKVKKAKEANKTKEATKSFKDSSGKPPVELIPWAAEEAMAAAFAFGATKYGRHNYKIDGLPVTYLLGAAKRHIGKFLDGIDLDDESGVSHLGHALCGIAMALDALKYHPHMDDRPKRRLKS